LILCFFLHLLSSPKLWNSSANPFRWHESKHIIRVLSFFRDFLMATAQITTGIGSFKGSSSTKNIRVSLSIGGASRVGLLSTKRKRCFQRLVCKSATVVAPKQTSSKPLVDNKMLHEINTREEKITCGILLPSTAQTKLQGSEVVANGGGTTLGKNIFDNNNKDGFEVLHLKYAGFDDFHGSARHLILKGDDVVGILKTKDIKNLKPLNNHVFIKVTVADSNNVGGLLITKATKDGEHVLASKTVDYSNLANNPYSDFQIAIGMVIVVGAMVIVWGKVIYEFIHLIML
ncbi:hypothetical protein GIB67_011143, partial [Kingdonia uniflora]